MKPSTLKSQLRLFLREKDEWIRKGQIVDDLKWRSEKDYKTFLSSTVDRTLRKLEQAKNIAVKYSGKTTLYHFIPEHMRSRYICVSDRGGSEVYWKAKVSV